MNKQAFPVGYTPVRTVDYTRRGLAFGLMLSSLAVMVLCALPIGNPAVARRLFLLLDPATGEATLTFHLTGILLALLAGLLFIALHEALHALFMRAATRDRLRCRVTGFGIAVFCPTDSFSRAAYARIMAAPAVLLTVALAALCLLLPAPYAGVAYLVACIHLGGCVADFYALLLVARAGKDARFLDGGTALLIAERR